MDKLALALSLISLLCVVLFLAASYALGFLEVKSKASISKELKMTKESDLNQASNWKQAA